MGNPRFVVLLAVTTQFARHAELSQFVPDHVFGDLYRLELLAIVDKESMTDEVRTDRAGASPRLDRFGGSRLNVFLNLFHQLEVDVGSFFQ